MDRMGTSLTGTMLQVGCVEDCPAGWHSVPEHPGLCWRSGGDERPGVLQFRLEAGETPSADGLAWLGLARPDTDSALYLMLDSSECHPGWLLLHQNRVLVSLPSHMQADRRLQVLLSWAGFLLAPTGETHAGLAFGLQAMHWRLKNYATLLQGLQQQMQEIRKIARGRKGLRAADEATVRLLGFLHRMEHEMRHHLDRARLARKALETRLERQHARHARLHPHHVVSGRMALDTLLPADLLTRLDEQARQAGEISELLHQKRQALQSILQLERDEEMSNLSRRQHWFSLVLAALAVMTAIPLITGELDDQGLSSALAALPGQLGWLAPLADRIRPWFAGLALVGSLLLMGSAAVLTFRRMHGVPELFRQVVAATGDAVACMKALGTQSSDRQCAQAISRALRMARRGDGLARFVCEAELGCRRPFPLPAPESARVLRLEASRPGQWLGKPEWQWIRAREESAE